MNKLIKIKDDHFVIVDDSKIGEGDYYIDDTNQIRISVISDEVYWQHRPYNLGYMKIIYSTIPLEDRDNSQISIKPVKSAKVFKKIQELQLSDVKKLIGDDDVEKLADDIYPETYYSGIYVDGWLKAGFIKGYNKAKEKYKFTEEDMRNCVKHILTELNTHNEVDKPTNFVWIDSFNRFIQSLSQPKTEWEVEFSDGKLELI